MKRAESKQSQQEFCHTASLPLKLVFSALKVAAKSFYKFGSSRTNPLGHSHLKDPTVLMQVPPEQISWKIKIMLNSAWSNGLIICSIFGHLPHQTMKICTIGNTRICQSKFKIWREPWSSGYGKRLTFRRFWVRIPAPYTGWTFIHIYLL